VVQSRWSKGKNGCAKWRSRMNASYDILARSKMSSNAEQSKSIPRSLGCDAFRARDCEGNQDKQEACKSFAEKR
jgi:hypothetical protein